MAARERLDELAGELDRLAEALTDVAMEVLREAVHDEGETDRLAATKKEKVINRARAAVEKAARLARQAAQGEQEPAEEW